MGYPELLRVLEEEAAREARDLGACAEREAARIVEEARRRAYAERDALVARERLEGQARRRLGLEALARERERALLVERRALLDDLRRAAAERLAAAGSPELDARLLRELLPEMGDGPLEVIVDPGAEAAARAALSQAAPALARRATVVAAAAPRGGVEVIAGRRVLDDTLPSRLERAWPELEAELARLLMEEG